MDWRKYWSERPGRYPETSFREQVGRTFSGGRPTPEPELELVLGQAIDGLELSTEHRLLDLCCGNGLLTCRLGQHCAQVVGVDYAEPMIRLARAHHRAQNVSYVIGSVLELPRLLPGDRRFTRAVMFESLAYLEGEEFPLLLQGLRAVCTQRSIAYLTGVLDAGRMWHFYDTPGRRAEYEQRQLEGRDAMGRWWKRAEILEVATSAGFRASIVEQDSRLNTAHYRYDLRLEST